MVTFKQLFLLLLFSYASTGVTADNTKNSLNLIYHTVTISYPLGWRKKKYSIFGEVKRNLAESNQKGKCEI